MDFEVEDGVAVITMRGKGISPHGTPLEEHRIEPRTIAALNDALDAAIAHSGVQAVVVAGEGRFFCNGLDLKWVDAHLGDEANRMQLAAEKLLARILTFELPTVAAVNGHCTAAGAMLALSFDYRVMNADRGWFFVPGIDLGLVYSPGMTTLMQAKTPTVMHLPMIGYAQRYGGKDLAALGVAHRAASGGPPGVLSEALALAQSLRVKGRDAQYRRTLGAIKCRLYNVPARLLCANDVHEQAMGFENKPKGIDRPQQSSKL
eukprot:g614.t1